MKLLDRRDRRGLAALLFAAIFAVAGGLVAVGVAVRPPEAGPTVAGPVATAPAPTVAAAAPAAPTPAPTPAQTPTMAPEPTAEPTTKVNVAGVITTPPPAPTASGYRIQIARLGINLPVAEGDVPRDVDRAQTPEHYAFHLPGTSMFGAGNTYIYAHARPGMFLTLWNVRVGDVVTVRMPGGTREYVVEEIHPRVPPLEISWAGPTSDTRLTLQTSTGPNGTDPRFVVVARPR